MRLVNQAKHAGSSGEQNESGAGLYKCVVANSDTTTITQNRGASTIGLLHFSLSRAYYRLELFAILFREWSAIVPNPAFDLPEHLDTSKSTLLEAEKASGVHAMLSEAYQWGTNHKTEIAIGTLGLLALGGAAGLARASRRAIAGGTEAHGGSALKNSAERLPVGEDAMHAEIMSDVRAYYRSLHGTETVAPAIDAADHAFDNAFYIPPGKDGIGTMIGSYGGQPFEHKIDIGRVADVFKQFGKK